MGCTKPKLYPTSSMHYKIVERCSEYFPDPQVKEYDAISRIDAWLTAQLLHIKKNIDSDETIN